MCSLDNAELFHSANSCQISAFPNTILMKNTLLKFTILNT